MKRRIKIIECPRDAMQGINRYIPWQQKSQYIETLLSCGFHTIDIGSFVNPASVPQMRDTAEVLDQLGPQKNNNRFLVIVANERGAREASVFDCIDDMGFPFSVNETFQQRNANSNIPEAFNRLRRICEIAEKEGKQVVAYISMAFGNPYNEPYRRDVVLEWTDKIVSLGIKTISLADTVGSASIDDIAYLFGEIHRMYPHLETGAHFHARPGMWLDKIETARQAGCRRFDGALKGLGGCPFAKDDLTGNVPTEELIAWLNQKEETGIDLASLEKATTAAATLFQN